MMKLWIYENHLCELRSEELYEEKIMIFLRIKHLYSAYREALCALHIIHTLVKNKNEKMKFR